jgi:hypothetical protein
MRREGGCSGVEGAVEWRGVEWRGVEGDREEKHKTTQNTISSQGENNQKRKKGGRWILSTLSLSLSN